MQFDIPDKPAFDFSNWIWGDDCIIGEAKSLVLAVEEAVENTLRADFHGAIHLNDEFGDYLELSVALPFAVEDWIFCTLPLEALVRDSVEAPNMDKAERARVATQLRKIADMVDALP